jgi:hypothetical protein
MKLIPLTKGQFAKVSDYRYEELTEYQWHAVWESKTQSYYARRWERLVDGKRRCVFMHRQILGLKHGDPSCGEHKNHDTLDNQDENLRIATNQQNQANGRSKQNSSSVYKGVSRYKPSGKWIARIMTSGHLTHLGYFNSEDEAAVVYNEAAKEHFGEFAYLNPVGWLRISI